MKTRRDFVKTLAGTGLASLVAPLWSNGISVNAFGQSSQSASYQAIVVVTMIGGNDGNNVLIPLDTAEYSAYTALRTEVALPQSQCNVLSGSKDNVTYGMHPSLVNTSSMYNKGAALVVANVGPLQAPVFKNQLLTNTDLAPQALRSHLAGRYQWESASTLALPTTGWGGRVADLISQQSGSLPPVFDVGSPESIFTVGHSVQAIALQSQLGSFVPVPAGLNAAVLAIANDDMNSPNNIVAQAAKLRVAATNQQKLISQAQNAGSTLQTTFPTTPFGQQLQIIASLINGRSVIGASRQIFYCQQGSYDTHSQQLPAHAAGLSEFDNGIGAFTQALQEMGLANQILVCTHSDFNRTMISNSTGGTDHSWGNHQLIIGSGIKGGRIIGTMPELEVGGPTDLDGYGTWIPSLSVTQMAAGIGSWMGLSNGQLVSVFPDLSNFSAGAIALTAA
jgi:uncharacterized protein (DUF1501 family)